jgi:hypothetical protein
LAAVVLFRIMSLMVLALTLLGSRAAPVDASALADRATLSADLSSDDELDAATDDLTFSAPLHFSLVPPTATSCLTKDAGLLPRNAPASTLIFRPPISALA